MKKFDTHFHIIDFRFPVEENQGFFPPSFPATDYQALRDLAHANPDCLMFGTDLPSQRARRSFLPSDIDLICESIEPALWDKVFRETAIAFYRPRQVPAVQG
jgi:predicted TIM-barrel fold metal-dependent hydrolase